MVYPGNSASPAPTEKKGMSVNSGRLILVAAAILWGLAGVCVKSITWGTMSLVASRSILAFFVLMLFRRGKRRFHIHFSLWNVLGALTTTATGLLYVQAIKMTTAGNAIVLQYIAPILVFLFAVCFQHRKARLWEILITLAVFAGIVLSFADSLSPGQVTGNLLAIASGFTYAGQIIIQSRKDVDAQDSLMISCILSLVIALPFVPGDPGLTANFNNIFWVLVLGICQYGLADAFFSLGIRVVDKVEASLILTIEPIFNPIPVAILCGEHMGPLALAGAAVVIICVALFGYLSSRMPLQATEK